jgi:CRP/FNR family transcriptional regulator, cyclic AMP receptor protein
MLISKEESQKPRSPVSTVDKFSLLSKHPLFRELDPCIVEHLTGYMRRRKVSEGSIIFRKGDPGTGLMGLLSGSVKISMPSADGRDIVLSVFNEGDIFGEMALLDGRPRSADAIAICDSELLVMDRREFIPFLRSQPDVTLKLLETLCSRLRRTNEQVQDLTSLSLSARLAKALLRLGADSTTTSNASGKVKITQREISQIVCGSRESTNKQLRAWAKNGLIQLEWRKVTVLEPKKLAQIAAEGLEFDPS